MNFQRSLPHIRPSITDSKKVHFQRSYGRSHVHFDSKKVKGHKVRVKVQRSTLYLRGHGPR